MNTVLAFFYFMYGLATGSFLNVVIYRLPLKLPISRGRSMCPRCGTKLKAFDLIPLFSYLFLKGKCRYCGAKISRRYPLVELLTAALFVLCFVCFGFTVQSGIICIFVCIIIAASFIDLDYKYVPDRFSAIICVLGFISIFVYPETSLQSRILGALFVSGIMLVISYLTRGGIGGGDIKLFLSTGLLLGFKLNLLSFALGYIFAGAYVIVPYIRKKLPKNLEVPMVPFFSIAFIFSVFWGNQLTRWYLSLF